MLAIFRVYIDDYSDFTVLTESKQIAKNLVKDKYQTSKLVERHLRCYFGQDACVKNYEYFSYLVYDDDIPSYVHMIQLEIHVPSFVHKDTLQKMLNILNLDILNFDSEIRLELFMLS